MGKSAQMLVVGSFAGAVARGKTSSGSWSMVLGVVAGVGMSVAVIAVVRRNGKTFFRIYLL